MAWTGQTFSVGQILTAAQMTNLQGDILVALTVGEIVAFADDVEPDQCLECDGASYDTTTYAALFAVIGYTYGGSASNFNVPDLRGEFIRGWAHGDVTDPDRAARTNSGGGVTGDNVGSKQDHELDSHRHSFSQSSYAFPNPVISEANNGSGTAYTGYTGGNETRPTNVYVMFCIRY